MVQLNATYGYRLFMDDYGDTWCATLVKRGSTWVVIVVASANGKWGWDALDPKKKK